jgi:polyhydroxyalkanoate synthesis regulator phasin
MRPLAPVVLSLLLLTGCGTLIPKRVEFFQDKVHKFPTAPAKQVELQKEAAWLAQERAVATLDAALAEGSSTNVVTNAQDTAKLSGIVSESLGPPAKAPTDADKTVDALRAQIAKLDAKIQSFAKENDENAGKKIEGTGLLQIPYFVYVGLVVFVLVIGWHLAKLVLTGLSTANPGALVGLGAMNVTGNLAGKVVTQVVQGGENFLSKLKAEITDPTLQKQVTDLFLASHKQAQDADVKAVVNNLTK